MALAQRWLGGLKGIEVGGAAHNDFEVDALNVDRYAEYDTVYKREELRMWGTVKKVDLVAPGDDLPLKDEAVDFVLASHVIEHFPDPVAALSEWVRVSRRYLFLVVPHRDRTFDRDRELTPVDELLDRHARGFASEEDAHWSVWTCESFLALCDALGLVVCDHRDPDYEGGNGFVVVIDAAPRARRPLRRTGRDSNPRYGSKPHTPLAGERLQPLGHLSRERPIVCTWRYCRWSCSPVPQPPQKVSSAFRPANRPPKARPTATKPARDDAATNRPTLSKLQNHSGQSMSRLRRRPGSGSGSGSRVSISIRSTLCRS